MIVLDASAAVDLVLGQPAARTIARTMESHPEVNVPEHFHVEALAALRRLRLHGGLSEREGQRALRALARLRAVRYPVLPLTDAIWALRERLTPYDAAYLALADRLGADVVTSDRGLAAVARSHGRLAASRGSTSS